jgi:peptidoglycan hydrolase CwlO-like protein
MNELNKENEMLKLLVSDLKSKIEEQATVLKTKEKEIDELKLGIESTNKLLNQSNRAVNEMRN